MMRVLRILVLINVALCLAACTKNTLGSRSTLCVRRPVKPVKTMQDVPNEGWIRLVLSDEDKHYDCTGQPLRFSTPPDGCKSPSSQRSPRFTPLRSKEVVAQDQSKDFGLVWIPMQKLSNGDRGGPVAFVHTSRRLSLVGVGMLGLPTGQVALKIQKVGNKELLFAEGERCGKEPEKCDRVIRLMLLNKGRFVPIALRDRKKGCSAESGFDLFKAKDVKLRDGRLRRFELTATYEIVDEGIAIHEQLVVTDRSQGASLDQARQFRTSDATRLLTFNGSDFVSDQESLFSRMLKIHGALRKRGIND